MCLLRVIIFLVSCQIIYGHNEDIHTVQYNSQSFQTELGKRNHFVMFFAPWCGHCQRLTSTWEQLAEMLNEDDSNIRIAKVDCTIEKEICTEHDVTGYPTLKFFKGGIMEGVKFRGTRDLPSLTAFINEQLENIPAEEKENASDIPEAVNGLIELTENTFEKYIASGKHFVKFYAPWCGHCQKLAPTWEQLAQSLEYDTSVGIAKVDCTQHRSICNQFEIKGYPTLLWIEDGKKTEKYQGQRTHEELKLFVSKMLGKTAVNMDDKQPSAESTSSVQVLTGDNFHQGIDTGIAFIKFFAPWCGHCKRLAPTWEQLGDKFHSNPNVNIVKVDCTAEASKLLCNEQEVDGFPTLFLYRNGEKVSEYKGTRTLNDLYDFVNLHLGHDEL